MLGKGTPSRRLRDTPVIRCPLPQTSSPANPLLKGKSVTYVSGTKCYLCLRSLNHLAPSANSRPQFSTCGFLPVFCCLSRSREPVTWKLLFVTARDGTIRWCRYGRSFQHPQTNRAAAIAGLVIAVL